MERMMTEPIVDPDKFVTVGKFLEPANAQMAKGMLESAGIECFLQGENANSLLALAFRARLLVHKRDEEAARQLLGSAGDELTEEEQRALEAGDDTFGNRPSACGGLPLGRDGLLRLRCAGGKGLRGLCDPLQLWATDRGAG